MPHMKKAGRFDVEGHYRAGVTLKDAPSLEEVLALADEGKVHMECSSFTDPGEDYTALVVDGKRITYWPGY